MSPQLLVFFAHLVSCHLRMNLMYQHLEQSVWMVQANLWTPFPKVLVNFGASLWMFFAVLDILVRTTRGIR